MIYAMFIVFFLLDIYTAYCQLTTTTITTTIAPNFVNNCFFLNNTYLTNAAVSNQFQFPNRTSIELIASYAFLSPPLSISTFELGLIYPFSAIDNLVPFPIFLNCASIVRSCQLKTMAGTTLTSYDSESISVQLTPFNYSSSSQINQMGLYLKEGRYQLSNCSLDDGQNITDPQTTFDIQIQYEKTVGRFCLHSLKTVPKGQTQILNIDCPLLKTCN